MHFSHAILLLIGTAAAIPMAAPVAVVATSSVSTKPSSSSVSSKPSSVAAVVTSKPASSSASVAKTTTSSSTSVSVASPSASLSFESCTFCYDLISLDKASQNFLVAVNAFTGGANVQAQGNDLTTAGGAWQTVVATLLRDVQLGSVKGGTLSTADSANAANYISATLTPDLVSLYNAIAAKKSVFAQVGQTQSVHDSILAVGQELTQISSSLGPRLLSADVPKVQEAGNKLTASFEALVAAFS